MASPNIVNVTSIIGLTTYASLADTSETVILSNSASSGVVYKVNNIIVANDDGTNSADITLSYKDAAAGSGTGYKLANTVAVAADSVLVAIDRSTSFYLEENTSITATASAGGDLDVICSYEVIS